MVTYLDKFVAIFYLFAFSGKFGLPRFVYTIITTMLYYLFLDTEFSRRNNRKSSCSQMQHFIGEYIRLSLEDKYIPCLGQLY